MADTMIHAMEHHAKDKVVVINALSVLFTTELSPLGFTSENTKGGLASWKFVKGHKEYHFRDGGNGCVLVYRNWYGASQGEKPYELRTRMDVIKWVAKVQRGRV